MFERKRLLFLFLGLLLLGLATASGVRAAPPVPPEARYLTEDERWFLAERRPWAPPSPEGEWLVRESLHFRFFLLPGGAAERDWSLIAAEAEASLRRVQERLAMEQAPQMDIYLVERVFWHGGAAYGSGELLISYLDRNYTNIPLTSYLDHEIAHGLAYTLLPPEGESSTMLAEGLATWAAGGHYGPEPIHALAAALPLLGYELALEPLRADFRAQQHERAYIVSASFVGWLIEQQGIERFKGFYGAADEPERFYSASYAELEQRWRAWLTQEWGALAPAHAAWWEGQMRLFDLLRAYESRFDPFARELPSAPPGWDRETRQRYGENRDEPLNVALESQLIAASEALYCQEDLDLLHALLDEVEGAVDQGRAPPGGALAQRLALAELLAEQAQALQQREQGRWLATIAPPLRRRAEQERGALARYGPLEQESVRLQVGAGQAVTWIVWYPRIGAARAYELALSPGPQGAGWHVTRFTPVPTHELIPRSNRLCMS